MKINKTIFNRLSLIGIAVICFALTSCDGDDSGNAQTDFQYFPLAANNSWNYDVTFDGAVFSDELQVFNSSGDSFQLSANPTPPNALMTNVLSNGRLTASNGKLVGTGEVIFSFQGINDLNISVTNAALYDQNASANTTLSTTVGSSSQSLSGFDLDINYSAKTIQQASLENLSVEGTTYQDVIHSQLIINASISSPITVGNLTTSVNILDSQDVFVVDNYWAKDVGLIKSESQFSYQLVDLSAFNVTLPLPESGDNLSIQTLTSYTVN